MYTLTAAQIAININFSGLRGEQATWDTVTEVKEAYFYGDASVTSLDLARALTRGAKVLRSEGRDLEASIVEEEFAKLEGEKVFSINDHINLYEDVFGQLH